ncbi:MAG: cytochrome c family protein [Rhodospirillum sp.]|nr:cytochrome c family protein [Rhodospirillum sp.]MCF8489978.1 cytochrome c family protein [Rhodospirillum sp.]
MCLRRIARNTLGSLAGAVILVVAINGYVNAIDPRTGRAAPTEVATALANAASGGGPVADTAPTGPQDPISLIASATPEDENKVIKACAACHTFDEGGPNRVGPNLHGVAGRPKGSHEGFAYSDAMLAAGGTWTTEDLWTFLESPKGFVPGTKMAFQGLKDPATRAAAIAYLRSQTPNPPPLEPPTAEDAKDVMPEGTAPVVPAN